MIEIKSDYGVHGWMRFFTFNSRGGGVAILVDRRVQFSASKIIADKNGRYLIIAGILFHNPVLLINIYVPNFDDLSFS